MDQDEIVDEAEDEFEQGQDLSDAQLEHYEATVPQIKQEQSLYNWFWKVVRLNKPQRLAKVGNLTKVEVGDFNTSMRDCLNLAHLGETFGHAKFGAYWAERSKITAATSMARRGWFMDLSISQRKIRERAKTSSSDDKKWRLFNKKKQQQTDED